MLDQSPKFMDKVIYFLHNYYMIFCLIVIGVSNLKIFYDY
jgi:hypothetical protein